MRTLILIEPLIHYLPFESLLDCLSNLTTSLRFLDTILIVVVRMRGLNTYELGSEIQGKFSSADIGARSWKFKGKNTCVQTTNTGESLPKKVGRTHFIFDRVFDEYASTKEIYEKSSRDIVKNCVGGISGSIIAYGQTGAGKTYTMQGDGSFKEGALKNEGVIHMAIQDLFSELAEYPNSAFLLRLSVIEVYNEEIRDLLNPSKKAVTTRYDSKLGLFVLSKEEFVIDYNRMIELLSIADANRMVSSTGMNERSSRSHTVYKITIERKDVLDRSAGPVDLSEVEEDGEPIHVSTLNFVDLAGSDTVRRIDKSDDDIQKEGSNINKRYVSV